MVADWKSGGTLAVLNGLLANDLMDERTLSSLFDCRYLIMTDSAFLAAQNRTEADLKKMRALLENEDYSGRAEARWQNTIWDCTELWRRLQATRYIRLY